eukprot:TRINITY_DN15821_c0_g1_i1.p1 TRINITY_DN15821_c0_g1~~TRINITY_DN15821_c0_g1_i1.p1  ORF type:complete len:365 (-),score=77.91 TRINITY_DN15821_c0_g1_i1:330-1364(-)
MTFVNKQWIYTKRPESEEVNSEHYTLKETAVDVKDVSDGQLLVQSHYISVDPYMRIQQAASDTWEAPHPLGVVQGSGMSGVVLHSKSPDFKEGDFVYSYSGWQSHPIIDASKATKLNPEAAPISTALGVCGMPARTAYFGLKEAGKPQAGETLVVSGAAGIVGSIVAQIGKIHGMRVVGVAGTKEKCDYLVNELGLDAAINYKALKNDVAGAVDELKKAAPNGVDVYWDNTGGFITDAIFHCINLRARVVICGQISQYNGGLDNPNLGPRFFHHVLYKRCTIQGILARDYGHRDSEMLVDVHKWLAEGKLKYRETVVEGFAELPQALNKLFHGQNVGKMVVKVA